MAVWTSGMSLILMGEIWCRGSSNIQVERRFGVCEKLRCCRFPGLVTWLQVSSRSKRETENTPTSPRGS